MKWKVNYDNYFKKRKVNGDKWLMKKCKLEAKYPNYKEYVFLMMLKRLPISMIKKRWQVVEWEIDSIWRDFAIEQNYFSYTAKQFKQERGLK